MNAESLVWFGIGGGALLFGLSLLHARYIARQPRAVGSRGGFTLFAIVMFLFAAGAFAMGFAASGGS